MVAPSFRQVDLAAVVIVREHKILLDFKDRWFAFSLPVYARSSVRRKNPRTIARTRKRAGPTMRLCGRRSKCWACRSRSGQLPQRLAADVEPWRAKLGRDGALESLPVSSSTACGSTSILVRFRGTRPSGCRGA